MSQPSLTEMTTKEFRAYVKTLTPEEADAARRERMSFQRKRWRERNTDKARVQERRRWQVWVTSLSEDEREALRARDAERKRRERASSG